MGANSRLGAYSNKYGIRISNNIPNFVEKLKDIDWSSIKAFDEPNIACKPFHELKCVQRFIMIAFLSKTVINESYFLISSKSSSHNY